MAVNGAGASVVLIGFALLLGVSLFGSRSRFLAAAHAHQTSRA